jgi:mRNA-degrading endonuclease RelE of RelBE toxin-antitoxin system
MKYKVPVTPTAEKTFRKIKASDPGALHGIFEKVRGLEDSPEKQGRALVGSLKGLRRIVAAGRYRIIYRVLKEKAAVLVVAADMRKEDDQRDIYEIAQKLIKARLL